jgi:hypothetical protein
MYTTIDGGVYYSLSDDLRQLAPMGILPQLLRLLKHSRKLPPIHSEDIFEVGRFAT